MGGSWITKWLQAFGEFILPALGYPNLRLKQDGTTSSEVWTLHGHGSIRSARRERSGYFLCQIEEENLCSG